MRREVKTVYVRNVHTGERRGFRDSLQSVLPEEALLAANGYLAGHFGFERLREQAQKDGLEFVESQDGDVIQLGNWMFVENETE